MSLTFARRFGARGEDGQRDNVVLRWVILIAAVVGALAADPVHTPFAEGRSVVKGVEQPKWDGWVRERDRAIRGRLEQGELDSMVNLLLFGNSFTSQPRIRVEDLAEAARSGVLRSRVEDLVRGLENPGANERLVFLRRVLESKKVRPDGVFVLQNLERVLRELRTFGERTAAKRGEAEFAERSRLFRDRGVSLDTSILPGLAIELALRDLKNRDVLRDVKSAAVIGPGLDFVDWDEGYDYYPQQTLQPFALVDSLRRVGLSKDVRVTVFDISARVLEHLRRARDRSKDGYTVQLPRDSGRLRATEVVEYWKAFGDRVGTEAQAITAPAALKGVETRAVRVRPEVLRSVESVDLNIVVQRVEAARVDLIVATNVLVYYDAVEQGLALLNVAAMLRAGGLFLVNSELPSDSAMRLVGSTVAPSGDRVLWYRKQ